MDERRVIAGANAFEVCHHRQKHRTHTPESIDFGRTNYKLGDPDDHRRYFPNSGRFETGGISVSDVAKRRPLLTSDKKVKSGVTTPSIRCDPSIRCGDPSLGAD